MTPDIVIVAAARTPVGRFRGTLAPIRADHLGAHVLNALLTRSGLDAADVDDVVMGCVTQVGEQCGNVARTSALSAGWPETVPGVTVDRKCGSGEAAIQIAAGLIASGQAEIVTAGGVESMTRVKMGGNREVYGDPFGALLRARFEMTGQGEAAERICDLYGFDRAALDAFALESHRRAAMAQDRGAFDAEIAPVPLADYADPGADVSGTMQADETIRRDTAPEKLAALKTVFRDEGRVSAGNASQISDGAAAVLLMTRAKAEALGLTPLARLRAMCVVGSDPTMMLTGPVGATRKVLGLAGLSTDDIDLFEVNEAFAAVVLRFMQAFEVDPDVVNVNGGAIAMGHPLGATGAMILGTLVDELERSDREVGLATLCIGSGMGAATVVERV
jgi:acetyl-CoA acyltransferase